uniref:Uncharacterized protein n=1 Tax=Heterorhabditis bacteriophora TaxID=37862 RepID=A0A1I7WAI3_HETBA
MELLDFVGLIKKRTILDILWITYISGFSVYKSYLTLMSAHFLLLVFFEAFSHSLYLGITRFKSKGTHY